MKKTVLGIKIDDVSLDQAVETVQGWLSKPGKPFDKAQGKHYIVTPNPEIVVMAQEDKELKQIINKADLAIPDGVGLKLSGEIVCHTPGIGLMERLIKMAADYGFTTGFLGGRKGIAEKVAECLKKKYPKLKVVFASEGGKVDKEGNVIARSIATKQSQKEIATLPSVARNDGDIDLLFVAFGPPKQEKWIAKKLEKLPVKVAMGVGGSFDILSGRLPRAPVWLRKLGLEWLFRLMIEPWRIKRQLNLFKYIWFLSVK